jgi:hypothetical protein
MITNPEIIQEKYKCNKYVKSWLIRHCQIPLMSFDRYGNFYFAKTDKLKECIKHMPLDVRILSIL